MKQDVRTNVIPPLKFGEKFGFLTFSTASNVVYQFKSIYYLFFLTNVLKIDVLVAGMILTIGTVWDAVNDPLIGFREPQIQKRRALPSLRAVVRGALGGFGGTAVLRFQNLADRCRHSGAGDLFYF